MTSVFLLKGYRSRESGGEVFDAVVIGIFTDKATADGEMEFREAHDEHYIFFDVEEWELNKPEPIQVEDDGR